MVSLLRVGVVEHCLNCGADIGLGVFPHYCQFCLNVLRTTGGLPSGLLEQQKLQESD